MDDLIGSIYDAAVDPSLWGDVLDRLAALAGASGGLAFQPLSPGSGLYASANLDPDSLADYASHYHRHDLWRDAVLRAGRPGVAVGATLIPPDRFLRSEFYNDFLRRFDIRDVLCLHLGHGAGDPGTVHVSLYAGHRREPFDVSEVRQLEGLLPHLSRAMEIRHRLAPEQERSVALAEALDAVARPVIVVNRQGRILHANRPAETMLRRRDGITVSAGRLHALLPGEQQSLAAAIEQAAAPPGPGRRAAALRITRPDGLGPALPVIVSPPGPGRAGIAIVMLGDRGGGATPEPGDRLLSELFGLTAAEAGLAMALSAGRRLEDVAQERGVTRETARSQLKSVFAKTGVNSQSRLVRLVLSVPEVALDRS